MAGKSQFRSTHELHLRAEFRFSRPSWLSGGALSGGAMLDPPYDCINSVPGHPEPVELGYLDDLVRLSRRRALASIGDLEEPEILQL